MRRGLRTTCLAAAAAGLLLAAACGGETSRDPDGEVLRGPDAGRRAVTPARYVTDVTFVPFDASDGGLHYRFRHVTSSEDLAREYAGWRLGDGGWDATLRIRDTLPVPRAGWRVLPSDSLGVLVNEGGETRAFVRRGAAVPARLELDRTLAEWSSPTGQRERLRRAFLGTGDDRTSGLVVERRRAQGRDVPLPRGLYGFLMVADSAGDGLVILRHGGTPPGREPPRVDTAAVAHGWIGGESDAWRGVRLASVGSGGGSDSPPPGGWSVDVPGAGIEGRLRPGAAVEVPGGAGRGVSGRDAEAGAAGADTAADASGREDVRIYAVSGTLRILGRPRTVRGIGVETGRP